MTKKKKSIISDQRFIVLLVIIALTAVFSIMSKEFRQYTTLLSMLDFSYYDLLMAIGVTFPLITGGVDLSIGTGMVCYALIAGTMVRSHGWPVAAAMVLCLVLGLIIGALNGVLIGVMNLPPFLATLCTCMITRGAGSLCSATPWPGLTQDGGWFHSIFKITVGSGRSASRYPIGFLWMVLLVLLMEFVLNHTKFGRYTIAILDRKQQLLLEKLDERPTLTVTFFVPDEKKSSGRYITKTGNLKKLHPLEKWMLLTDGTKIPLEDVKNIESPLFCDGF